MNPLVIYFKNNLGKYKKEDLINQALQQGWNQEQIENALRRVESLGDGGEEHDKPGDDKSAAEGKQ